ncbi:hypothetical protein KC363_g6913 [Hortaea werneckii]|nr:hypothetical protein KC363_g6913 [Hortaea werneckii]
MTPSKSNSESPSKGPGEKPELTKERLEENNVSYSKDIHDPAKNGNIFAQLPPHIEYVRESLLNFRNSLPKFDERYHELLRRDVKDLGERMEDEDLPPVIAFTCIGPAVQVWLTYRAGPTRENGDKMRIHMQCIYATHLELLWGVHSCRLVIKHMHVWASRILKPRIWVCLSSLVSKTSLANGAAIGLPQESCNDEQVQSGVQSADEPSPSLKTPSKESRAKLPVRSPRIPKASGTACPLSSSPRKSAPYTPNLPKTGGAEEAAITPPESPERPETPECRPTGASTSKSPFISGPTFPERKPYLFGGSTSAEGRSGLFGMFHKAQKSEQSQPFSAGFNGKKEKNVSAAEVEDLVFGFGTFGLHSKSSDTSNKKTHTRSSDAADLEGDQQAPDAQTYRYHTYRTGQPREIFVEEELDVDDGEWMPQHYLSRSCSSDETSDFSDDGSDEDSESDFDCDSEDQDGVCSAPKSKSAFGSVFDINPGSREKPDGNHPKDSDYASSTRLGSHPSSGDGLRDGKDALGGNSQFDRPANSDTTSSTSHHCGEELKEEEEKMVGFRTHLQKTSQQGCLQADGDR